MLVFAGVSFVFGEISLMAFLFIVCTVKWYLWLREQSYFNADFRESRFLRRYCPPVTGGR